MWRGLWSAQKGLVPPCFKATCRLVESPPQRVLVLIGYPDVYQCADHVPEIMQHKPIGLEGFDGQLVSFSRRKGVNPEGLQQLPDGGGWLLAEFGGETIAEAEDLARKIDVGAGAERKSAGHAVADRSGADQAGLACARVWTGSCFPCSG